MGIEGVLNKPGQDLEELHEAWFLRLREAARMLDEGFSCGAILAYMYAFEIRLKVCICDHLELDHLPKAFEFHDPAGLTIVTGLQKRLNEDETVRLQWIRLVVIWKEYQHARYRAQSESDLAVAREVRTILTDPTHGVFAWLSKHRPHGTPP